MTINSNQAVIEREQFAQLLSFNFKSTLTNSFFAIFLAYAQLDALPPSIVLSWLFSILIVNIARFFTVRYCFNRTIQTSTIVRYRLNIFRIGLILSSILWGLNILLVLDASTEDRLFVGYLLAGISAGAALVYSIDYISAIAFPIFSLLPAIFIAFLAGNSFLFLIGLAGIFYVLYLIISVKTINQRLIEGVLLREEAVKNAEEIKHLAFYDSLTSLPNRRLLLERLDRSFSHNLRTGKRSALLFIDLDNFKKLNDEKGHDMGDMLLMEVANRLTKSVRESDTIARFGGDEFIVILENLSELHSDAVSEVEMLTQNILGKLATPYQLIDFVYNCTASIGVAMFVTNGRTRHDLLKHADIAMYHAKQSGGSTVSFYDASMKNISVTE